MNVEADVLGYSFIRVRKVTLNAVQPRLLAWGGGGGGGERDRQIEEGKSPVLARGRQITCLGKANHMCGQAVKQICWPGEGKSPVWS